ncbi:MAG: sugar phosphate nucleotidyltransferase [Halanaerobiales bacterium]
MKAVIMAGGRGTRLRPLSCNLPKPLVPIINYPVMEQIIYLLAREGITEIAVTTFYLPDSIENYFGNGNKWGVNLHYFREESPLGTAGSVHNASDFLDETFVVISGDAVMDFSIKDAVEFHRKKGAETTLVLSRHEIPLEYGVVITDEDDKIIRFLEKPDWGQVFSDNINTGVYVLEPSIFTYFEKGENYDFSQDLFPLLLQKNSPLYGYQAQGYWNDIGNIEAYLQTHYDFLDGKTAPVLPEAREYRPGILIEDGVDIHPGAKLTPPLYIGAKTHIEKGAVLESSIIGCGNLISSHSELKKSVIWNNCYLGKNSIIRGSVLANNVTVKSGASVAEGAALGKGVEVNRGSQIRSGVRVWPERKIAANEIVRQSIVHPRRSMEQLFSRRGIRGELNIDINPEFVSRLAGALTAILPSNSRLTVSSDSSVGADALRQVMVSSLNLAGLSAIDLKNTLLPAVRYTVNMLQTEGGVHFRAGERDPEFIVIEFLNERGVNISPGKRRKLARKMALGDYNRANTAKMGDKVNMPEMSRNYLQDLFDRFNIPIIRRNFYRLVADYRDEEVVKLLSLFMKKLNCQVILEHGNTSKLTMKEKEKRFKKLIIDNEAEFAFYIGRGGEKLFLMTAEGRTVSNKEYQVLIARLLLKKGVKKLFLPVNTPAVIEDMARKEAAEVIYHSTDFQAVMEAHRNYQEQNGNISAPYFNPYFDAFYSLGLILEELAERDLTLNQLLAELPDIFFNQAEIDCPERKKGKIMRRLAEDSEDHEDLIDGVKFYHEQGWALVIPDTEKQIFHIFSEGVDIESAEELTGYYLDKIKKIIDGE